MLEPTKKNNYKSLYLANLDRKYLDDNNEGIKMPNIKHISSISDLFINERTTFTQLWSQIQSTQNGFRSIAFNGG